MDPNPPRPYVPPTPAQRTADAFKPSRGSPLERLRHILAEAPREHTRPLLLLGEPKDPACVELFRLFYEDPEPGKTGEKRSPTPQELRWQFELAALDTGRPEVGSLAGALGITIGKGKPPVLAVLDDRGALVDIHALRLGDPQKLDGRALAAFLAKYKPATRDAERMLADGLSRAKTENKRVFFIASASWCGPCRLLARFLAAHKSELERHYVFVKLDISRDTRAEAVWERFRGKQDGGVPWYAILDADGKALASSNLAKKSRFGTTNVGFPSDPEGIEHFLKMLAKTAQGLSEEELGRLRKELGEKK